jgi:hypothetical protein
MRAKLLVGGTIFLAGLQKLQGPRFPTAGFWQCMRNQRSCSYNMVRKNAIEIGRNETLKRKTTMKKPK